MKTIPTQSRSLTAAIITIGSLVGGVNAAVVNWGALGLDHAQITTPGGQIFTDFAGITGLTSTLSSSTPFLNTSLVHPSGNLVLRTDSSANTTSSPVFLTFSFNQDVKINSSNPGFFGDGGVQEEVRYSSSSGSLFATVTPDNTIDGSGSGLLTLRSGSNSVSEQATITSPILSDFTIGLGGQGFTGIAATTFTLDIEAVPEPSFLLLIAIGTFGFTWRRVRPQ